MSSARLALADPQLLGTPPCSSSGCSAGSAISWSPLRAMTSQRTQRAPRSSWSWPGVNMVQVRIEVARSARVPPTTRR